MNSKVDKNQLKEILDLDYDEMKELLDNLISSIPKYIDEISLLCKKKDRAKIKLISHKIKGETGNFGLISLSNLFDKLENEVDQISFNDINKILTDILTANKETIKDLENLLDTNKL